MKDDIHLKIPKGAYVVAVSGGVDSVTLLDLLSSFPSLKLTVAHFDHGIRQDSKLDRILTKALAAKYRLPFVYELGYLNTDTSEDEARDARYKFLNSVFNTSSADAIITAHHQDDQIETAILNLIRGTGRKGLTSLKSNNNLLRPLLNVPKQTILNYAKNHNLIWREDSTNSDPKYKRNYIRQNILTKLDQPGRQKLVELISETDRLNQQIDTELDNFLETNSNKDGLKRLSFIKLPHKLANEVMASWLRQQKILGFNSGLLDRLTIAAKTFEPGHRISINNKYFMKVGRDKLALVGHDR